MASMTKDPVSTDLRARLEALEDRISHARTAFSEDGVVGDHLRQLSLFSDKHEAIRQSLDTGGYQAKASSETDELENSVMRWLETFEGKVQNPLPRAPKRLV
jgi:hypothetical protein